MRKVVATGSGMFALWGAKRLLKRGGLRHLGVEIASGFRHRARDRSRPPGSHQHPCRQRLGDRGPRRKRGSPASLTERESGYVMVSTPAAYWLRAQTLLHFGGIEHIHTDQGPETGAVDVPPGDYEVQVHLVDWQQEPGMTRPDGTPNDGALPDFIVVLNPAVGQRPSRISVNTFD